MNVGVVGLGKLGLSFAALVASKGHQVTGVDVDEDTVDAINMRGPIVEPHVDELITHVTAPLLGRSRPALLATTDYADLEGCNLVAIIVPTPSSLNGRFDASAVVDAVRDTIRVLGPGEGEHTIAVCSTVMPGTIGAEIMPLVAGTDINIVYTPFFVALGDVLLGMVNPDFQLVGATSPSGASQWIRLAETYVNVGIAAAVVPFLEAEIAKLAINTYLTVKISFANMLGELCSAAGAQPSMVAAVVGSDRRIGRSFLQPGAPPGGPCLPRDTIALQAFGEEVGVGTPLASAVREQTDNTLDRLVRDLRNAGRVAILGLAYKPGTTVIDGSLGSALGDSLQRLGAEVRAHDPAITPDRDAQQIIGWADTVVIATPWPQYATLDFDRRRVYDPWALLPADR